MTTKSDMNLNLTGLEIAIVGLSGRFPGADDIFTFWCNLKAQRESITFFSKEQLRESGVSEEELSRSNYVPAAGILSDVDLFDLEFFGFNPLEAKIMDPQHRIFLECAWEALEDAAIDAALYRGRIGVFGGLGANSYLFKNLITQQDILKNIGISMLLMSSDKDFMSTRVAYKLNLTGPAITVQTACSTSLVAVHLACQSLIAGEVDAALAGGVRVQVPHKVGYLHQMGDITSPDGHCRAFDAGAMGTVSGNGAGIVVLKRLEDALNDRDEIYAIIKGSAVNNDGASKTNYSSPGVDGQSSVILSALNAGDVDPETISYVEAHGTGTFIGDPIEIEALTKAYRLKTNKNQFCYLGSVKSNIGHLDVAAGIVGLIKTALMLRHKTIPASLHFNKPNPEIPFEKTPFKVVSTTMPWAWEDVALPRRAGVSSFGIGGTNAHVVIEEYSPVVPRDITRNYQLIALSARSLTALERFKVKLLHYLNSESEVDLGRVSFTLLTARQHFKYRFSIVGKDSQEIAKQLSESLNLDHKAIETSTPIPSLIYLFPGQGSQYVGMCNELYKYEPTFRKSIDDCAKILKRILGIDLLELILSSIEILSETRFTQPALFSVEYSLTMLLNSYGIRPTAMIGHSLGEFVAAAVSGVFTLEDALAVVCERGRLMQQCKPGGMVAVSLSVIQLDSYLSENLEIAAVNSPEMTVISGPYEDIDHFEYRLKNAKIEYKRLQTSHAFHSAAMESAREEFCTFMQKIKRNKPTMPYISNLTGSWIDHSQLEDDLYWYKQLRGCVQFADGLQVIAKNYSNAVLIEVGPGRALTTIARANACFSSVEILNLLGFDRAIFRNDQEGLLHALGAMWRRGIKIDWPAIFGSKKYKRCHLPSTPFERVRCWVDSGIEKKLLPRDSVQKSPEVKTLNTHSVVFLAWRQVLGRESIGPEENFFQLGGHSLLGIRLTAHLSEIFEIHLPIKMIFEYPTIRLMTEWIDLQINKKQSTGLEAANIPKRQSQDIVPLSPAQRRIWLLCQMSSSPEAFNVPVAVKIEGHLEIDRIRRAFELVISRHEILKIRVKMKEGNPTQGLIEEFELPFRSEAINLWQNTFVADEIQKPFDLQTGPLIRMALFSISADKNVLVCTAHHIVSDHWSLSIFLRELLEYYQSEIEVRSPLFPTITVDYLDYSLWANEIQAKVPSKADLEFWVKELKDAPELIEIPTDFPRPSVQSYLGKTIYNTLDSKTNTRIQSFCNNYQVTPYHFFVGITQLLLHRYSGQKDIVLGSPVTLRTSSELQPLIGIFVDNIALRATIDRSILLCDFIKITAAKVLECLGHSGVTFEQIVKAVKPHRDLSYTPIFQTYLNYLEEPFQFGAINELNVEAMSVDLNAVQYDLTFIITKQNGQFSIGIAYSSALFNEATVKRILENLNTLIVDSVEHPEHTLSEIAYLSEKERRKLDIFGKNPYPIPDKIQNVVSLFENQVEKQPDAIALQFENLKISYKELNQRAEALANELRRRGVGADDIVAIALERSIAFVVSIIGVLKSGGAYLPIDLSHPRERIGHVVKESSAAVVIVNENTHSKIPANFESFLFFEKNYSISFDKNELHQECCYAQSNLAYLLFTSGSTGIPQGVLIEHKGVINEILWRIRTGQITRNDRLLHTIQFGFDPSVWQLLGPLSAGGQVILVEPEIQLQPSLLVKTIQENRITIMDFVPSALRVFIESDAVKELHSLRLVFCGGEALSIKLRDDFFQKVNAQLFNQYGPTEATIDATAHICSVLDEGDSVPIGKPISNQEIYLLDGNLQPVPVGCVGDIYLGGIGLARGYLNKQDLTRERFIHLSDGRRVYHSGDRGRFQSGGLLLFLGRIDQQVKVRGFRIDLLEVEKSLEKIKEIYQVAVVSVKDEKKLQHILVAFVVKKDGVEILESEIRENLNNKLPNYMIPSLFVFLDQLPLSPSGKVDRKKLPSSEKIYTYLAQRSVEKPKNKIESDILKIFIEILMLNTMGVDENFFDVGGDSLLAMRLSSAIEDKFKINIPVNLIFECPTPRALAKRLENKLPLTGNLSLPKIGAAPDKDLVSISFAQELLIFKNSFDSPYNQMTFKIEISGELNLEYFLKSFHELSAQNSIFKTKIEQRGEKFIQTVDSSYKFDASVLDITDDWQIDDIARQENEKIIDIRRVGPMRMILLRFSKVRHVLLITIHRFIYDAWTSRLIIDEILKIYSSMVNQEDHQKRLEKKIQFRDYTWWEQNVFATSANFTEAEKYWRSELKSYINANNPLFPVKNKVNSTLGQITCEWPSEIATAIRIFGQKLSLTPYIILLSAYCSGIRKISGKEKFLVATPVSNRKNSQLHFTIGRIVNLMCTTIDFSSHGKSPFPKNNILVLKDKVSQNLAYQDFPAIKIFTEFKVPFPDVYFNYDSQPSSQIKASGLICIASTVSEPTAECALSLTVEDFGHKIIARFQYLNSYLNEVEISKLIASMTEYLSSLDKNLI